MQSEHMSAETWWAGICSSSPLSILASDVLNMPASTASTERTFSTHGFIHSAKRNRLTVERAGKLAYIKHNHSLLNNSDRSIRKSNSNIDCVEENEGDRVRFLSDEFSFEPEFADEDGTGSENEKENQSED